MKWLAQQFGMETWRMARAIEPTEEFFPDQFDGSETAVRLMLDRVCGFMTGDEDDHEPLTDLATVFFGLGIFNANSAFRFSQWTQAGWHGCKASTLGYLNEQKFGYALGLWTIVRGEANPAWMKHLRLNPRTYIKQTVRYLKANPPAMFLT